MRDSLILSATPHTDVRSQQDSPAVTPPVVPYFVLCRDAARVEQWRARTADMAGVNLQLRTGYRSMYRFISDAVRDAQADWLVVAHDDVIVGHGFAARLQALLADLAATVPNWGIVGNAGVAADGWASHVYVKDPWCQPQAGYGPETVACVDGNLILIHKRLFEAAQVEYPDLEGFHGYDLVLSFECLRKGLLVLADSRLGAVHLSGGNHGVYETYMRAPLFQNYFASRFADAAIPSMLGSHPVTPGAGGPAPVRPTLQALVDAALRTRHAAQPRRLAIVLHGKNASADAATALRQQLNDAALPALIDIDVIGLGPDDLKQRLAALPHDHLWLLPAGAVIDPVGLGAALRAVAARPEGLVVGGYAQPPERDAAATATLVSSAAVRRAVHAALPCPAAAAILPRAALRPLFDEAGLGGALGDGSLMVAQVMTTPGVRGTWLRQTLVVLPPAADGSADAPAAAPGYGSAADWAQASRLALLNTIVARSASAPWATATHALLAPPPPLSAGWATDLVHFASATRSVLRSPGRYLQRALSLGARYVLKGDFKGLMREARLFRPR